MSISKDEYKRILGDLTELKDWLEDSFNYVGSLEASFVELWEEKEELEDEVDRLKDQIGGD